MWETLSKILPPPLLAGLLIYAGVCFLWLQPLIEERKSNITYIPQCEAGRLPSAASIARPPSRTSAIQNLPRGLSVPDMPNVSLPLSV